MPLSEHEQKLLEQMESALYAEDPRFATHMKGAGGGSPKRGRIVGGIVLAVAGLGLVVAGVATSTIPLGAVGFVVMVAGIAWAVTPSRPARLQSVGGGAARRGPAASKTARGRAFKPGQKKAASPGSFMQRMEDRWEKRRRDQAGW